MKNLNESARKMSDKELTTAKSSNTILNQWERGTLNYDSAVQLMATCESYFVLINKVFYKLGITLGVDHESNELVFERLVI